MKKYTVTLPNGKKLYFNQVPKITITCDIEIDGETYTFDETDLSIVGLNENRYIPGVLKILKLKLNFV